MNDSKYHYSSHVADRKQQALTDAALDRIIKAGHDRKERYHQNWQSVNLNDLVEKFARGSIPYDQGGKVVFHNPGGNVAVIVDVGGGYCRLQKIPQTTRHAQYLDIDGHDPNNIRTPNGKQRGRSKEEKQAATHFLVKKRGGDVINGTQICNCYTIE